MEPQKTPQAEAIQNKKNNLGGITIPDYKTHYRLQ